MLIYDIALSLVPGIGGIRAKRLIDAFGTAEAVMKSDPEEVAARTEIPPEAARKIFTSNVFPEAEKEVRFVEKHGFRTLVYGTPEYPRLLGECDDPPLVLYVRGGLDFNAGKWLAVVGTRRMTAYGRETVHRLICGIASRRPDTVVVSGLAYGTDVEAHRGAMRNGLKTVAVMATPLSRIYPSSHRTEAERIVAEGGALVTEFRSDYVTRPDSFLQRNRIMAALSAGTLVVESALKGGSISTATHAVRYGRDVLAVPGRAGDEMSEGTNRLIHLNKAALVTDADQALQAMNWDYVLPGKAEAPVPAGHRMELTPEEKKVFEALSYSETLSLDELSAKAGLSVQRVSTALFVLEMEGAVRRRPGNRVEKAEGILSE